jgi:uncharacterized glyoxalase superfamily protein PhnB
VTARSRECRGWQRLHAAGVQFDSPPQRQPWATEAVLRDPDGNMLVLQQA